MSKRTKKFVEEFKTKLIDKGIDVSEFEEYFKEIESNLKDKKYGLVWEEHTEEIEKELLTKFPILKEEKELRIHNTEEGITNNFLIEGDNLESLTALRNMGKKVDLIEIDPPYNTMSGEGALIYEDRRVDKEDSYRHSKWISFMSVRLNLAKDVLNEDGVVFIHIDDNEYANLKLLCDRIFGEINFISNYIWNKGGGKSDSKYVANRKEYILCYRKSEKLEKLRGKETSIEGYKLEDSKGVYKLSGFDRGGLRYSKSLDYAITTPDGDEIYPGKSKERWEERMKGNHGGRDWCWTLSVKEFNRRKEAGEIVFKKIKGDWRVYYKSYFKKGRETPFSDVLEVSGNNKGSTELKDIFNKRVFDYPKPLDLLKFFIKLHPRDDITVLDFFAGSGSLGHAVIELNKEDGGNRNFILCTNNENNICRDVTYQRLNKVINGYTTTKGKEVEGMPSNLTYLKTELIEKEDDLVDFGVSEELLESMINNLKVLYNITKEERIGESLVKLENDAKEMYLYTNFYVESEDFKKVKESKKPKTVYVSEDNLNDINLNMFDEVRSLSELLVYK